MRTKCVPLFWYTVLMLVSGGWKLHFIRILRRHGSPRAAARHLSLPWSTVTSARQRDKHFRATWDDAVASAKADLEQELQILTTDHSQ